MLNQKVSPTTSTTWQDNHSGRRRHKLMTKELADSIPPLYANDGADDPALAQPGHQHLAGAGGNGRQRVIAAGAGIAVVARSLLGQSIGLADGRVQVDGQGRVAGSGPSGPRPGPTTGGSRGRVDGHAPTGSCAGTSPGWMAP